MKSVTLVLVLLGFMGAAEAQTSASRCASIKSDAARLACYDRTYPPAKKLTTKAPKPNTSPDPTRDPVERVLSLYKFIKVDFVKHPLHGRFASGEITFDQWIARRPPMASNVMTKMVSGLATEYEPSTPAMLPVAMRALHDMAAVGIQERFNESVDAICQVLDWTPVYEDRNRSSLDNSAFIEAEKISAETLAAIRVANQMDAALYAEAVAMLARKAA